MELKLSRLLRRNPRCEALAREKESKEMPGFISPGFR